MKKTFFFLLILTSIFYISSNVSVYAQDFPKAYCIDQENDTSFEQRCKNSEMNLFIERNKKIMELENNSFTEEEYNIMYSDIMNSYFTIINSCNIVKQSERVECLSIEIQEQHRDDNSEENVAFKPIFTSDDISVMRADLINYQLENQVNRDGVVFEEEENLKNSYYKEMIALHRQVFSIKESSENSRFLSLENKQQTSKSNTSPEKFIDQKEKKNDLIGILIIGCIILAVVLCPILIFVGCTNQAVVFYDAKDLAWSFVPIPAALIAFSVAPPLNLSWDVILIRMSITICFILIAGLGFKKSIVNAIFYNRNKPIGIALGLMKPFVIAAGLCGIIGKFNQFSNPNSTRAERANALLVLAFWIWVGRSLINGKAVYKEKGWSEPPSQHNTPL